MQTVRKYHMGAAASTRTPPSVSHAKLESSSAGHHSISSELPSPPTELRQRRTRSLIIALRAAKAAVNLRMPLAAVHQQRIAADHCSAEGAVIPKGCSTDFQNKVADQLGCPSLKLPPSCPRAGVNLPMSPVRSFQRRSSFFGGKRYRPAPPQVSNGPAARLWDAGHAELQLMADGETFELTWTRQKLGELQYVGQVTLLRHIIKQSWQSASIVCLTLCRNGVPQCILRLRLKSALMQRQPTPRRKSILSKVLERRCEAP